MKVCIIGAGAIGGFIGTRLALAGRAQVSVVARGATLQALQTTGWRLKQGGQWLGAPARAVADPAELGPQDLVVVAVKAPAMAEVASRIGPLLSPATVVLPAMNGVPWWFQSVTPALGDAPLEAVDPGGRIAARIPVAQVLGCAVHASTANAGPGVVEHQMGAGLLIGEPAGGESPRAGAVVALMREAGFDAQVSPDIRRDLWYKLWGNLTMNPITAITGATVDRVLDDPLTRAFCSAAMGEAARIGERIGCAIGQTPEDRHQVTRKLGAFRTSMLQDVEAGRPIELDALVGAVLEIAGRVQTPAPAIEVLMGLARLHAQVRGLYPSGTGSAAS